MKKKLGILMLILALLLSACQEPAAVEKSTIDEKQPTTENEVVQEEKVEVLDLLKVENLSEIDTVLNDMTLEEKAGQLIQAERAGIQLYEISEYNIGSILSGGGSAPENNNPEGWVNFYNVVQEAASKSSSKIPVIYGIDAVHGNNNLKDATIFPHNIGLGAANNPELMQAIGKETGLSLKAIGLDWNFAPAVSVVQDIRWGRSYESYSENVNRVSGLASAYIKGLQDTGIIATTKHFIGDGQTTFGTGEGAHLIDRGDVTVSMDALKELNLPAYEAAIKVDTKTIMASFNSVHGTKVHGNKPLLTDLLRNELGFKGLVVSDWEAIHTIAPTLKEQVALSINAGVDMLMQPYNWKDVYWAIIDNVEEGQITEERLNEAVKRVLALKYEAGLLEGTVKETPGEVKTNASIELAREAVSQSMVLLKNKNNVLPLEKSAKIYLMGPAIDNVGYQCGGWTLSWQGEKTQDLNNGISIKDAFINVFTESNGELVDDPEKADIIVLAIGESPYAEFEGDTDDLSLNSKTALKGNLDSIEMAKTYNKPVVTLMVAGRPMLINDYIDDWDAFVMTWLPGTQGNGITDVLFGEKNFLGTLPVTWPIENNQAPDTVNDQNYMEKKHQFKYGDGLKY